MVQRLDGGVDVDVVVAAAREGAVLHEWPVLTSTSGPCPQSALWRMSRFEAIM